MTVAAVAPVTDAVVDALKTLDRPVGDAVVPDGWGKGGKPPVSFFPYSVVYAGTTLMDGTFVHPKEDGLHRVQISCVGLSRESAETLRDDSLALLLAPDPFVIDGHALVWSGHVASPPTFRDDDVTPPQFNAVAVVHLMVTPDGSGS